jgi:hypothetical protein
VYGQQKGPWGCGADTEGAIKDCDVIYTDGPWGDFIAFASEAIGDLDQQVYMPWYEAQSHQDGVGEDVVEHCLSQQ